MRAAPSVRFRHALDAIATIEDDVGDMGRDDFMADGKTVRAVERSLLTVAETATLTPKPLADAVFTSFSASELRKLGNDLRHDYMTYEPWQIWRVVKDDIPQVKSDLTVALSRYHELEHLLPQRHRDLERRSPGKGMSR